MNHEIKRQLNGLTVQIDGDFTEHIKTLTEEVTNLELVRHCTDIVDVYHTLNSIDIDLILMDVACAEGFDFRNFKTEYPQIQIILIGLEIGFENSSDLIFDFLTYPLSSFRFELIIHRLIDFLNQQQKLDYYTKQDGNKKPYLQVNARGVERKVFISDIILVEANGEYINYHTIEGKFIAFGSLKKTGYDLGEDFTQVHRSFVVNTSFIISKTKKHLRLIGNRQIPIGSTYKNKLIF